MEFQLGKKNLFNLQSDLIRTCGVFLIKDSDFYVLIFVANEDVPLKLIHKGDEVINSFRFKE